MTKQIDPQAAMEQIWKTAPALAKARGELVYIEEYRKSLKAILMKECAEQSAVAQEREAYADPRYVEHLQALKVATEQVELLRWRMVSAQAAIEIWRSTEASNRATDRAAK